MLSFCATDLGAEHVEAKYDAILHRDKVLKRFEIVKPSCSAFVTCLYMTFLMCAVEYHATCASKTIKLIPRNTKK